MFFPRVENLERVSCFAFDRDFFNITLQNHPGNALESIFKASLAFFDSNQMIVECLITIVSHFYLPLQSVMVGNECLPYF